MKIKIFSNINMTPGKLQKQINAYVKKLGAIPFSVLNVPVDGHFHFAIMYEQARDIVENS